MKGLINRFKLSNIIIGFIILLFSIFCLAPMVLVVMVSFTDESSIQLLGYQWIPSMFSLDAYKTIFRQTEILLRSYMISIFVTLIGTLTAVLITAMAAYTLANKQVYYRNSIALFFFVTMVFNAGIVPWYIMCSKLGLRDNILALIIPSLLFNPFNLFLVRNFMYGIPPSLLESAKIDGANDIFIAIKIFFPLSIPVLSAVALFYGLNYWNDWWNAIMLVDNRELYPLQYLLFKLQSEIQMLRDLQMYGGSATVKLPTESLKMATVVLTIGPIVFLYPYLQKYFVKGLIIGSVKG